MLSGCLFPRVHGQFRSLCHRRNKKKYACIKSPHVLPGSRARGDVALTPKHLIWPNNIGGSGKFLGGLLGLRVHVILFWLLADVCRQCLDCFLFRPICDRALFCAIFAASNCSVLFVVCSIQHLLLFGSSVINNLGLGALSFCLSIFCGASASPPVTP